MYCLNTDHAHAGQAPLYLCLRAGCAAALQEGLFSSGAAVSAGEDGRPDEEGKDERAPLVLQLLLGSLDGQAPTLAHMLLGFDAEDGPEGPAAHLSSWPSYASRNQGAPATLILTKAYPRVRNTVTQCVLEPLAPNASEAGAL